jgi:hypothetical protein
MEDPLYKKRIVGFKVDIHNRKDWGFNVVGHDKNVRLLESTFFTPLFFPFPIALIPHP